MILKNNKAYKSIGEVAKILVLVNEKKGTLNTHTIRFWEKEFKQIKPTILNGNRRYYNNDTIEVLKKVKHLLKVRGMTINGVKKILNGNNSLELDEMANNSIKADNLRIKLIKISNIVNVLRIFSFLFFTVFSFNIFLDVSRSNSISFSDKALGKFFELLKLSKLVKGLKLI